MRIQHALIAVAAVILTVGNASAPAHANAPASAVPAKSSASAASCGKPIGSSTDANGDSHYRYEMPNGAVAVQHIAAANFDPDTATPERIMELGLPVRPKTGSPDRSEWNHVATDLGRRLSSAAAPCTAPGVTAAPSYSPIYSGYRAHAAAGKNFSGAHTSYTAPSFYVSTCTSESMTQWVGVSNDRVLVQAGQFVTQYTGPVQGGAFFEIVGGSWETAGLQTLPYPAYAAGHRYYFAVQYADRYDWNFTVDDLDTGVVYSGTWHNAGAGGTQYIQPLAYVVSERLTYSGTTRTQYMNHSVVSFRTTTAHIDQETDARFSIESPTEMVMVSDTIGARLANNSALNLGTSNFTESWARCGAVE